MVVSMWLILFSYLLPHKENRGYPVWQQQIKSINGIEIDSFTTVIETLKKATGKYIKFIFANDAMVILDREKAVQSNEEILGIYGISKVAFIRE